MIPDGESIQVEKGKFARIHNDILTALAVGRFTGSEYRCLLFLFRMTYGWQKKEDTLSISQWAAGVGMEFEKRHNVWRTLQGLVDKKVICVRDNGNNRPKTWGFNKYIEQWDASLFPLTVMPSDNSSVIQDDNSPEATVIPDDNSPVMPQDNKTVMPQDTNKRQVKKEKEKAATPSATLPDNDSDKDGRFTIQLVKDTGLFFHFGSTARTQAAALEETYTMEDIRRAVDTLVSRHNAKLEKRERGIIDPIGYLTTMMQSSARPAREQETVKVEIRLAPDIYSPNGRVKETIMTRAAAEAKGHKIVETMQ